MDQCLAALGLHLKGLGYLTYEVGEPMPDSIARLPSIEHASIVVLRGYQDGDKMFVFSSTGRRWVLEPFEAFDGQWFRILLTAAPLGMILVDPSEPWSVRFVEELLKGML